MTRRPWLPALLAERPSGPAARPCRDQLAIASLRRDRQNAPARAIAAATRGRARCAGAAAATAPAGERSLANGPCAPTRVAFGQEEAWGVGGGVARSAPAS